MTNRISLIYRHPMVYKGLIYFLYGKNFNSHYEMIAKWIPDGSEVLDVCCGDATLYSLFLKKKKVIYKGIDINPYFIKSAEKKEIKVDYLNILEEEIPKADYIVVQASLYQFIPNQREIMKKLLSSTRKRFIISEPISNLSQSKWKLIKKLAQISANPGTGDKNCRFIPEEFIKLLLEFEVDEYFTAPGGRDIVGIFNKKGSS